MASATVAHRSRRDIFIFLFFIFYFLLFSFSPFFIFPLLFFSGFGFPTSTHALRVRIFLVKQHRIGS
jgi:hypothetical protein